MFYDKSDPDFPNWWEVIDEGEAASESGESVQGDAEGAGVEAETHLDMLFIFFRKARRQILLFIILVHDIANRR